MKLPVAQDAWHVKYGLQSITEYTNHNLQRSTATSAACII